MTTLFNAVSIAAGASDTASAIVPGSNGLACVLSASAGSPINGCTVGVKYSQDGTVYSDAVPLMAGTFTVRTVNNNGSVIAFNVPGNGAADIELVVYNNDPVQAVTVTLEATPY